jgi:hypothetical protein
MFDNLSAFVNGNMFFGIFGTDLFLRLSIEEQKELLKNKGASMLEPMKGKPMKDYIVLPRPGEPSQRPFVPGFRNHLNGRASYRLRRQENSQVLLIAILRVIVPGFGSDSDSQVRKGIEV